MLYGLADRLLLRYCESYLSLAPNPSDRTPDTPTPRFGEALRQQVEERLTFFETGAAPGKNADAIRKVLDGLALEREDGDGDEEMEDAEPALPLIEAEPPRKKDKKKKRKLDEMDVDEEDAEPVKKVKLSKEEKKALKKEKKLKRMEEAAEVSDRCLSFVSNDAYRRVSGCISQEGEKREKRKEGREGKGEEGKKEQTLMATLHRPDPPFP